MLEQKHSGKNLTNHTINHPNYGKGVIKEVTESEEGYWTTIEFESVGRKTLLSFVDPLGKDAEW